jgi:hypothetical protein
MQTQIKCLAIRVPIGTSKYPEPTFYRVLTKLIDGKIIPYTIENIYWLDSNIYSEKQLIWLADIKTKILRLVPEAEVVEYSSEASYKTASGEIFTLLSLQKTWTRKITTKKRSILSRLKDSDTIVEEPEDISLMPSLIPMAVIGKHEANLYRVLCQYATRLHYEKMFQFEYLYVASKIYNKNSEDRLHPKKLLKLTQKAFDFISEEIKDNPENFKQKLTPRELRRHRIKHGATVLQKSNKRKRDANTAKVQEAIATDRYYKADGTTLNVSALANSLSLSRPTITAILKTL